MEDLLAAFICRPITIQKFMNILLTQYKTLLTNLEKDSEGDTYDNQSRSIEAVMPAPLVDRTSNIASLTPLPKQKCYANIFRIYTKTSFVTKCFVLLDATCAQDIAINQQSSSVVRMTKPISKKTFPKMISCLHT